MKKYFYELMTDIRRSFWDQPMCGLLWLLSLGYGCLVAVTRTLYQKHVLAVYHAPKPVISIGNITLGGSGKTPLVIALVKTLENKGVKTAVLSRGYGSCDGINDEVQMFRQVLPQVPVITGRDRKKSIQKALNEGPVDIFVADDAFSHWPLQKDLEIVVVDAGNPFGNGHLLPRGILREPVAALKRADVFVLTKTDQVKDTQELCWKIRSIKPNALIAQSHHEPENFQDVFSSQGYDLQELRGKTVAAFCALGSPVSFENSLKSLGLLVKRHFSFMDHHHYTQDDIETMVRFAKAENIDMFVTTHKDAVKIIPLQNLFEGHKVLRLNIHLKITSGEQELVERIFSLRRH